MLEACLVGPESELWSLRKLLRRAACQEYNHIAQIQMIL